MLAWHELLTDLAWHEILHRHFRSSQNRKWITAKWLTHGKQLQEVVVWGKLENPFSRPILIYFEFRSKPSLITVIAWTLTRPTNFNLLRQNIVFSYSERMTVSFSWLFHYFSFFFLFCYFTFLWIFTKIILLLIFIYFFYSWKIVLFFHVPGCSMFLVLSTPRHSSLAVWWSLMGRNEVEVHKNGKKEEATACPVILPNKLGQ